MISILLCTYNGAKYLSTQFDSILKQTYKDFVIYVHDDGSTDDTLKIIDSYSKNYPDKIFLLEDTEKHRGAGSSFMWLLKNVESEYYMFCDQDDFWLPNKIKHTFQKIKEIESLHPQAPILIHTDLHITDKGLNITHNSFWEYHNFKVDISKQKNYIGFGNIVTGCTVMINHKVKDVAFPYTTNLLHDYWLALKVAQYGYVENIKEQTILYRQHGSNEAGAGLRYSKHNILFHSFLSNLSEEIKRYKMVSGNNNISWFIHRVKYFYYRHFS